MSTSQQTVADNLTQFYCSISSMCMYKI